MENTLSDPRTAPRPAGLGTRLVRAAMLRCPHCGEGRVLESWFRMRERCPVCGIRTARGEDDFMLGAMVFNIAFSEGVLAVVLVSIIVATWPDVPWLFLRVGGPVLMVLAPIFFLPFSRTAWMAFEPLFFPVSEEEAEEGRRAVRG